MPNADPLASYEFRANAFVPARRYVLYGDMIVWDEIGDDGDSIKRDEIRLSDIVELELKYAPGRFQTGRCTASAVLRKGGMLVLASNHYAGIADFEDRSEAYAAFVRALAPSIAAANPSAKFTRGYRKSSLYLGAMLTLAGGVFISVLIVPIALATGLSAIVPLAMLMVLSGPAAVAEVRRNWPGVYDPNDIPAELLPGEKPPVYADPALAKIARAVLRK